MAFNNYVSLTTKEDRTIYVDYDIGTDDFDHGDASGAGAYKTLTWALLTIPKNLKHDFIINVAQNTGTAQEYANLQVKGFFGEGSLSIVGKTTGLPSHGDYMLAKTIAGNTLFEIINCATEINIQGIELSVAPAVIQGGYGVRCYGSPRVFFDDCLIYYHSVGAAAEYSSVRFKDCDFKENVDGLRSNTCALVEVEDCTSSTTNVSNGMVADSGIIFKDGTSPTGSVANEVEQNGGIISPISSGGGDELYDVIVDAAGGGDYTSLYTAFNTEGADTSFFIKKGTYAESDIVQIESGCRVFWDDVTLDLDDTKYLKIEGPDIVMRGNLRIEGIGEAQQRTILWIDTLANDNDWKGFTVRLVPECTTKGSNAITVIGYIENGADRSNWGTWKIYDWTTWVGSIAGQAIRVIQSACNNCELEVIGENIDISNSNVNQLPGVLYPGGTENVFKVNITNCIGDAAAQGTGVTLWGSYSTIYGVCRDCSGTNFVDSGSGDNSAALIT